MSRHLLSVWKEEKLRTGLTERSIRGLRFAAEQKAVSYTHLAQFFAPNYEPACDCPPLQEDWQPQARGGNRRNTPWPGDLRARLHAVSQLVEKWRKKGFVCKERPYLDQRTRHQGQLPPARTRRCPSAPARWRVGTG